MKYLTGFGKELLLILLQMAPYLILGFLIDGLLHLFIRKKSVRKYMGQNSFRSILNASMLGVPLPLCSCGVIPTGISFYKHGASKASTVSFLISTPQTGVDSIFVTYSMLGLPFAIIRPVVAFITGLLGGLITRRLDPEKVNTSQENEGNEDEMPKGILPKIKEMFRYSFVEFLQDISNWLIIGLLIAALISIVIPDNFFTDIIPNDFLGMFLILIISIPVYICATASVPVAAVLMLKGLSPGAALVLLMAGPATNAATITMIGKVLGKKSLIGYLGAIVTGALISGLLIDYFLPVHWFIVSEHFRQVVPMNEEMFPAWLNYGSAVLLIILLLNGYVRRFLNSRNIRNANITLQENTGTGIRKIQVDGMTCNHCKENVENIIKSSVGVEETTVDLVSGIVIIKGSSIDIEKIKAGIESIGYKVIGE